MISSLIKIGNSKGIRIPKPLLVESGIVDRVAITVKMGEIKIVPVTKARGKLDPVTLMSENSLSDWDRPEEDKAWEKLQ